MKFFSRIAFWAFLLLLPVLSRGQLAEVPFEMIGDHMVIELTLEGKTLKFMVDTGAGKSVLDTYWVKKLKMETMGSMKVKGVGGVEQYDETVFQYPALNDSVEINFVSFLSVPIRNMVDLKYDGIIGRDLFAKFVVEIDQDAQVLRVYDKEEDLARLTNGYEQIPIRIPFLAGVPFAKLSFTTPEGRVIKGRFLMDTGAFFNVGFSHHTKEKYDLERPGVSVLGVKVGGVGDKKSGQLTLLPEFQLGDYHFPELVTYFHPDQSGLFGSRRIRGLVGFGLLKQFNTIWDYKNRMLYLQPRQGFTTELPRPRAGIQLRDKGEFPQIGQVFTNTPAESLGLEIGQEVVSIDGNTSRDLAVLRQILAEATHPIEIVVRQHRAPGNPERKLLRVTLPMEPLF